MTQKAGTYVNGELWLRCPYCGDSDRRKWIAHFSISGEGLYHCLRCKASGRLPTRERIAILTKYGMDYGVHTVTEKERWQDTWDKTLPGPGTTRASSLRRNHLLTTKGWYDVFSITDIRGGRVGIQTVNVRTGKKKIRGNVKKAFGFPDPKHIWSDPEDPIILVEGPYDVAEDRYACTFGIPSYSQLKALRGQFVMLYPDGDVWHQSRIIGNLQRNVERAVAQGLFITGALKIPNRSQDPEDVWKENGEVEILSEREFMSWRS